MGKLWLIGGGGALALLLIVSVAVALLESEQVFEAGTSEGAVQSFLLSIEDEDFQTAYTLLSAEIKETCSLDRLFASSRFSYSRSEDSRITHENTTTIDSTTVVTVRISSFRNSGPFDYSESSHDQRYVLRQEEGEWRFVEYPWPLSYCGSDRFVPPTPVVVEPTRVPTAPTQ